MEPERHALVFHGLFNVNRPALTPDTNVYLRADRERVPATTPNRGGAEVVFMDRGSPTEQVAVRINRVVLPAAVPLRERHTGGKRFPPAHMYVDDEALSAIVADASQLNPSLASAIRAALFEPTDAAGTESGPLRAPDVVEDIAEITRQADAAGATTRTALVAARVGQGPFRDKLVRYWGACAVSGVSEPAVLRASHIKPWRDASDDERLDPYNGLLLSANLDALFDAGLITFDATGGMRVAPSLSASARKQLGIVAGLRLRRVEADHAPYLEHHRRHVFGKRQRADV